jgi:cytochrome P450
MTETLSSHTADPAIPEFSMARAKGCPFDPPPHYGALRAEAPVSRVRIWDGTTPWLITKYDDQRAVLSDQRFSADVRKDGYPHQNDGLKARRSTGRPFIAMDDPDHARLRRTVTAPFTIRRVDALRPRIQHLVDNLIDDLLAGPNPADLVEAFALPVPSLVICELLGVPYADHGFFQSQSRVLVSSASTAEDSVAAQRTLLEYLEKLIDAKKADLGDDLLSRLITERLNTGEMTRSDLATMGMLLLVAGHETTANMIALGTLALLEHPDQLAVLRDADDPKVIAGAVEELLRYLTIVHSGRRRVATEDIEVGGTLIRAGEGVILATGSANRDSDQFPDADALDVTRDARRHVAFGFGVHQCLGQPLARVELQVVYGTLYRRIPTLRLAAPVEKIPFKNDGIVYGVYELPVAW